MTGILEFFGFAKRHVGLAAWRDGKAWRALEILLPLAMGNDQECQNAVGRIFMSGGENVERDNIAAVKWLNLASRGGFAPAAKAFAEVLSLASKDEVAEGRRQAFAEQQRIMNRERGLPEQAEPVDTARLKLLNANDATALGSDYNNGRNTPVDFVAAFQCFLHAAEIGDRIAQYNVGIALLVGKGVKSDPEAAYVWFKRSADQGWDQSMVLLAKAHISGNGAQRDDALALNYLDRATVAGNSIAPQIAAAIKAGAKFTPD